MANIIELENTTKCDVDIELLEQISLGLTDKTVELLIVDDTQMATINKQYRNINTTTDVLSFAYKDINIIGSIVISCDKVIQASDNFGHSQAFEIALLFIHGMLHNLGYDHENDDGQMRLKEQEIIKNFNLPNSLIVRGDFNLIEKLV